MEKATTTPTSQLAAGEKAKARDIIAAISTLKTIEQEKRPATAEERQALAKFGGFGAVAVIDLSRSGHRPLQGCRLADPRRRAQIVAQSR